MCFSAYTNKKMNSFKSNENTHKEEDGSYYVVLANKEFYVHFDSITCVGLRLDFKQVSEVFSLPLTWNKETY